MAPTRNVRLTETHDVTAQHDINRKSRDISRLQIVRSNSTVFLGEPFLRN